MGIWGCRGMSWDVNAIRWYLSVSENGVDFPKAYFNENMMNQLITGYPIFKICQNLPPNLAVAIQTFGQPTGGIWMTRFNSQSLWVAQVFEHKPGWPSASNIFKSLGSSLPVAYNSYNHCRSPVSISSAVKLAILKTFGVSPLFGQTNLGLCARSSNTEEPQWRWRWWRQSWHRFRCLEYQWWCKPWMHSYCIK